MMDFIPAATADEFDELSEQVSRILSEGSEEKMSAMQIYKCLALGKIAIDALAYASEGTPVPEAIDLAVKDYKEMFV